jgi:hypothetical protein
MASELNSADNKYLLWNVLDQQSAFTNIVGHDKSSIITLFEKHIQAVDTEHIDLISKNKKVIDLMIRQLNGYKKKMGPGSNAQGAALPQETIIKGTDKSNGLNANYMKQHTDMTVALNPSKPQTVDFSETLDEKLEENEMNVRLASMMSNRNLDVDPSITPPTTDNINLTIGGAADMNDIHEIPTQQLNTVPQANMPQATMPRPPPQRSIPEHRGRTVSWSDDINNSQSIPEHRVSWSDDINNSQSTPDINKLFNKLKLHGAVGANAVGANAVGANAVDANAVDANAVDATGATGANAVAAANADTPPSNTDIMNMLLEIKDAQADILALLSDRE